MMKIKKMSLSELSLLLLFISIVFSDTGIVFYLCSFIFILNSSISLIKTHKLVFTKYQLHYAIFIIYLLVMVATGNSLAPEKSLNRIIVLILNFTIYSFVCISLKDENRRDRLLENYCVIAILFELYVIICTGSNLLSGRLGSDNFNPIIPYGSNGNLVAFTLVVATLIDWAKFNKSKQRHRVYRIIIYMVGILLTGSRKGIISFLLVFLIYTFVNTLLVDKNKFIKMFKKSMISLLVCVVLSILVLKIPFLYDIAGNRLESMLAITEVTDSSISYRNTFQLIAKDFFYSNPIVGIGIDSFSMFNPEGNGYSHSDYWELLCGTGIIGSAIYYSLYIVIIIALIKNKEKKHADIFLTYMIILAINNFQFVTYLQRICMLFLFIACTLIQGRKKI